MSPYFLCILLHSDNMVSPIVIAEKILQHIGAMCLHELNYDLVSLPLSNYVLQHNLDVVHLERVIDIVQYAVRASDQRMLIVGLIMLQVSVCLCPSVCVCVCVH